MLAGGAIPSDHVRSPPPRAPAGLVRPRRAALLPSAGPLADAPAWAPPPGHVGVGRVAVERPAALGAWAPAKAIHDPGASGLVVGSDLAVWRRAHDGDTVVQAAVRTDGAWAPAEDCPSRGRRDRAGRRRVERLSRLRRLRAENGGNAVVQARQVGRARRRLERARHAVRPGADASQVRIDGAVGCSAEAGESRIRVPLPRRHRRLEPLLHGLAARRSRLALDPACGRGEAAGPGLGLRRGKFTSLRS